MCLCVTAGLSDLAGPQGVWDAARRTLHHPRERRRSVGGVRRRAQSGLPQTFYHGPQSGWHGGGPLVPQELPIPALLRTKIVKGPFIKRRFFPPEVFTMETERSWRDGEIPSKGSRVGTIQWMLQAAGRWRRYICMLTICRESDHPVFAQNQIIPFALFGLCVICLSKNHKLYHPMWT